MNEQVMLKAIDAAYRIQANYPSVNVGKLACSLYDDFIDVLKIIAEPEKQHNRVSSPSSSAPPPTRTIKGSCNIIPFPIRNRPATAA